MLGVAETESPTYITDRRIGKAVAAEIAYAGLSRQAVANAIQLDKGSLSRSIAGERQWKASELIDVAEFLDIPASWLLEPRRPRNPTGNGDNGATVTDQDGQPGSCEVVAFRPRLAAAA